MRATTTHRMLVLVALVGLVLTGCSATHVNEPPIAGASTLGEPNAKPIPDLMARSILVAMKQADEPLGDYAINLPANTSREAFDAVLAQIGGGRVMSVDGEVAFHVTGMRLRADRAEVDVMYPRNASGDTYEFMTVYFRKPPLSGFKLDRHRIWRFRVTPPPPHMVLPEDPSSTG